LLGEDSNGIAVEEDRLLTDEDFKRIRKLRKKKILEKIANRNRQDAELERADFMPSFDILAEVKKAKVKAAIKMRLKGKEEGGLEGIDEEDLDELNDEDLIEMLSEDEFDELIEGGEGMEEEDFEGLEESMGEEEGSELSEMEKAHIDYSAEENELSDDSIDLDDISDEDINEQAEKERLKLGFLRESDIRQKILNKRQKIELSKQENKEKMAGRKMGLKLKERGRTTNDAKQKSKPFMMMQAKAKGRALNNDLINMTSKVKTLKNQLGHISKRLSQHKSSKQKKQVRKLRG
jgi:hypothetical protein